ncbi:MAG TPA: hypothetical protein VFQ53_22960 [Kofleriaceae bacterium]|nr:hypothetical protein [Kofleriaceae bacterium]
MVRTSKLLAAILSTALLAGAGAGCNSEPGGVERWATTENTNVKIDWDKVNEAYKQADGPEDLERRINEIYEGDELISISVQDTDAKTQVVTGFFDKNKSGNIDEGEKIFTIKRDVTGEGTAQVQTTGYGPYYGYTSPLMSIATGMLIGSMMSHAFSPAYVPVYSRPYTTSAARMSSLESHRSGYRAANPTRFSKPSRTTGRSYGGSPSRGRTGGSFRGGGRFGLARAGRTEKPVRLDG